MILKVFVLPFAITSLALGACDAETTSNRQPALTPVVDADLAEASLRRQIEFYEEIVRTPEANVEDEIKLIRLYNKLGAFFGDTDYYANLMRLEGISVNSYKDTKRAARVAFHVDMARRNFLLAEKDLAACRELMPKDYDLSAESLDLQESRGIDLLKVLEARSELAVRQPTFAHFLSLAQTQFRLHMPRAADESIRAALRVNTDTSPFSYSEAWYWRGKVWESRPARAQQYFEVALRYLPQFANARMALASIYAEHEKWDEALDMLGPVLAAENPRAIALAAQIYQAKNGPVGLAQELHSDAVEHFEALLSDHPLLFAESMANFNLALGVDLTRAAELAEQNFANTKTAASYDLLYRARRALGDKSGACDVLVGLKKSKSRPDYKAVYEKFESACN